MFNHNPYQPLSQLDDRGHYHSPKNHAPQQERHQKPQSSRQPFSRWDNQKKYSLDEFHRNIGRNEQSREQPDFEMELSERNFHHKTDYYAKREGRYRERRDHQAEPSQYSTPIRVDYSSQREESPRTDRKRGRSPDYSPEQQKRNRTQPFHRARPFAPPPKDLEKKVLDQSMQIETLEDRLQKQQKVYQQNLQQKEEEVSQLKKQLQQLQKKRIKETVSEKLSRYCNNSPSQASAAFTPAPSPATSSTNDYSQAVLLKRINLYLDSVKKEKISEKGYCHGIVLLWLSMMSWNLEPLFYEMIKLIADCPLDQLHKIENTITLFLDWIEVGQFPGKYSNKECTQQNIDEIIGDVHKLFSKTGSLTQGELEEEIKKLRKDNYMLPITGWWNKGGQEEGHSVGVFVRANRYHFFDPNYKSGKHQCFDTEPAVAKEIWERVFNNLGIKMEGAGKFSVNALTREANMKSESSYSPTLFSIKMQTKNPQLEEYRAPIATPC
jgi:hypothetical protein